MRIYKSIVVILFVFTWSHCVGQESDAFRRIQNLYNGYVELLPYKVAQEKGSYDFHKTLEDFVPLLDSYLKAGSGLSFDEMNQVRVMRSHINAMAEFTWLGGAERNCGWSEKKSLQIIKEIYPDVLVENVFIGENACITVISVQMGSYVFYAGTHDEKKKVKRVYYQVNFTKLHTVNGYCGIQANKYTKICDNADVLSIKYFSPKIIECKIFDDFF